MKRWILLMVVLAGTAGVVWAWQIRSHRSPEGQLILYGNVDVRQVDLAFLDRERVAQVLVEEGDQVEPGQLIGRLETERFEYDVARAAAQVETQRQVVARLEAGTREEEIRKARADVDEARAAVDDAARTHKRLLGLLPEKAASQQQVDDARAAHQRALARLAAAQAMLDLAIAGPRKEDIAQAKALLKHHQAELALAQYNLKVASLYAPSKGIIQERLLEVGDMASPERPAYTMALISPVWVRAYVSEPDLGRIAEGMKAVITTDSYPDHQYEGWVGFISPTAEFTPKPVETTQVRTKLVYQVRVFARNPSGELRLGMPATVAIDLDSRPAPTAASHATD